MVAEGLKNYSKDLKDKYKRGYNVSITRPKPVPGGHQIVISHDNTALDNPEVHRSMEDRMRMYFSPIKGEYDVTFQSKFGKVNGQLIITVTLK